MITTSTPGCEAISSAFFTPSCVSIITTTSMLSLMVERKVFGFWMIGLQMLPAWPPPVLRLAIGGKRANIATERDSIASSTVGTMMPSAPTSTALCTFVSVASGMRMIGVAGARGHAAIIFSISSNRRVACCISKREKSNVAAPSQYTLTSNDVTVWLKTCLPSSIFCFVVL